tara:strand:- start:141 stop:320 length:180 start_codon:yes stop_codon:yes gene_type:complete
MGLIDKFVKFFVNKAEDDRKKKNQSIIDVTDPKMRKIAKKYRAQIAKNTQDILKKSKEW